MARIALIGSGFSGLSAAAYLAAAGHHVDVFEKNGTAGGRARQINTETGYVFDMGPSWYWMPDVFEHFFNDFGYAVSDLYELKPLNPAFEIVFAENERLSVPQNFAELREVFESIEKGSALKLDSFLTEAQFKYETAMENLVHMPGRSIMEFANRDLIRGMVRLQVFSSLSAHVRKYFANPKLIALMEFPVLFLGALPSDTPALYSLMNYAALKLGTWYPMGGFGKVIEALVKVVAEKGGRVHYNCPVQKIIIDKQKVSAIIVNDQKLPYDALIASADYHYVEKVLLPEPFRNYTEGYWTRKIFAPSCLIFFIGLNKKIRDINHHTLFFEEDFDRHAAELYKHPQWPAKPLFYVCCPSRTDESVAPSGHENLFFLMPLAPGLEDNQVLREKYFEVLVHRLEKHIGEDIRSSIDYSRSYCIDDFVSDYHAYKGNAYGLANTLMQTAVLKPKIHNKKIKNLFYTGQLTVPGPGVPPSLMSGKIAAGQLMKYLKTKVNETAF